MLKSAILDAWHHHLETFTDTSSLPYITFTKPGAKPTKRPPRKALLSNSLLEGASDWVFLFDLEESLVFPPEIALTTLRPDAVIYSRKLKSVILFELTVPTEDRVSIAESIKTSRYKGLISECHSNGWKSRLITVEIGCRGFTPNSLMHTLKLLGLPKASCAETKTACSVTAYRCSYVIYLNRKASKWHTLPYIVGH